MNLDYLCPDEFCANAKDLIQKLLVLDPNERLGAKDTKRYMSIRSHLFYRDLDFDTLHITYPPSIDQNVPENSQSQELPCNYQVPDYREPGLDDNQLTRLLGVDVQSSSTTTQTPVARPRKWLGILQINNKNKQHQLNQKMHNGKWHSVIDGNLIVKQGLVDRRKVSIALQINTFGV